MKGKHFVGEMEWKKKMDQALSWAERTIWKLIRAFGVLCFDNGKWFTVGAKLGKFISEIMNREVQYNSLESFSYASSQSVNGTLECSCWKPN